MTGAAVGIIANPAAGKDIRRLVAEGRFVPNNEKRNIVRRILAGLDAVGIGPWSPSPLVPTTSAPG